MCSMKILGFRSHLDIQSQTKLIEKIVSGTCYRLNLHFQLHKQKENEKSGDSEALIVEQKFTSSTQIQGLLEKLLSTQATQVESQENNAKVLEEGKNPSAEGKVGSPGNQNGTSTDVTEAKATEEIKASTNTNAKPKTTLVCAIKESELNKVELAFFKRPVIVNNLHILSDK